MLGPDVIDPAPLRTALASLATQAEATAFDLPSPHRPDRLRLRRDLLWSVREHLQPRLGALGAPAVVALIGSTGAGKSTLLNSIAQDEVSRPGAVRPTTRVPVVWTHADHGHRYAADLLPSFAAPDRPLRVVTHTDERFREVTVVDTPDLDSVVVEHRQLADELLASADLCIWVTTAQRYADAVPWEVLRGVRDRHLPLMVVLNRVPDRGADRIADDLRRQLRSNGVVLGGGEEDVLTVPETIIESDHGGLSPDVIRTLHHRLIALGEPENRQRLVAEALRSSLHRVLQLGDGLVEAVGAERQEAADLAEVAHDAYAEQHAAMVAALEDGRLIHGEVVERWQQYVGTGELLRVLSEGVGRVRTWLRRVLGGPERVESVRGQARSELAAAVVRRADRAANGTATAWELSPTGATLLEGTGGLMWRADPATEDHADRAVQDWLLDVTTLVESEGAGRRRVAQVASAGVNGVAVTLMLAVFAQTGGLTGAEVGITAGAAAVQQRVLEHVFGTAAARRLVLEARDRLGVTVGSVLLGDRARFDELLTEAVSPATVGTRLEQAREEVRDAAGPFLEGGDGRG